MLLLKPGDSLPQIQLPRSGRIMGQILIQCGFGGLFNWLRCGKIWLADGKKQAAALLAPDRLVPLKEPALIAEDFSFYQQELPGLFFFLGTGSDQPLHSDRFCFDESVLEQGVALYQTLLQL